MRTRLHISEKRALAGTPNTPFHFLALSIAPLTSPDVARRTRAAAANLADWDCVIDEAVAHGLASLLFTRLREAQIDAPRRVRRRLEAIVVSQAHAAAVRAQVGASAMDALAQSGVEALALKGHALAHLVYASPRERPMCDVDLLVPRCDATAAWQALRQFGFLPSGAELSARHHHLRPLSKAVDGVRVTIEIHRELLCRTPFVDAVSYEQLTGRAQPFICNGREYRTLGREDMLWHVYAHAFVVHVLRPHLRLLSVADLVLATETWADVLQWERLSPRLRRALRSIGSLTPWSEAVSRRLGLPPAAGAAKNPPVSMSSGWRRTLSRDLWWPDAWWFDVKYGVDGTARRLRHRLITHPASLAVAALYHSRALRNVQPS